MARSAGLPKWRDPGLLVLGSLASGPKHGYAITHDLRENFGAHLGPGTLYGALGRLEERGLIEPLAGDERRRPYRLTAAGSTVLAQQTEGMQGFASVIRTRLTPASPSAHPCEATS